MADLASSGSTNTEIARSLFISVSTVETHLAHIFAKLAIGSRRELRAALTEHHDPTRTDRHRTQGIRVRVPAMVLKGMPLI